MKGRTTMEEHKHPERAILIYFITLIVFVIFNMLKEVTILDIIFLIALLCAVCKYFMVVREMRK